jgi:hypothetical protein
MHSASHPRVETKLDFIIFLLGFSMSLSEVGPEHFGAAGARGLPPAAD